MEIKGELSKKIGGGMSDKPFDFEWEETSIRSVTINAKTKKEAFKKWRNGEYGTPHFDSQDVIGEVVTIDGEEYYLTEEVAECTNK